MLDILGGEESGTKCPERQDRPSIVDIHNRYLSPGFTAIFGARSTEGDNPEVCFFRNQDYSMHGCQLVCFTNARVMLPRG